MIRRPTRTTRKAPRPISVLAVERLMRRAVAASSRVNATLFVAISFVTSFIRSHYNRQRSGVAILHSLWSNGIVRRDTRAAWVKYETTAKSRTMRVIAREARRRDLNVREFAQRAKRDVKVVTRWFEHTPRARTVERACKALPRLSNPGIVARALLTALDGRADLRDRDEFELLSAVLGQVGDSHAAFIDPGSFSQALGEALAARSPAHRREALAAFAIAHAGLADDETTLRDSVLAPSLIAFCNALRFDPKPFLAAKEALSTRAAEAAAALQWLLEAIPTVSGRDKAGIRRLVGRYGVVPRQLVFRGALAHAQAEFRRTLGHSYGYLDALATYDPIGENK